MSKQTTYNFTDIFHQSVFKTTIKLSPTFINKNIKNNILDKMEFTLYGKYTKYGMIRKNSIEIIKISAGIIEDFSLQGNVLFDVLFKCFICNPIKGNIILGTVINSNDFAVLCSSYDDINDDNNTNIEPENSIINTLLLKNNNSFKSDIDLDTLKIKDKIYIEILTKKTELNDKIIHCVGKAVKIDKIFKGEEKEEIDDFDDIINEPNDIDIPDDNDDMYFYDDDDLLVEFKENYDLSDKDDDDNSDNEEKDNKKNNEDDDETEVEPDDLVSNYDGSDDEKELNNSINEGSESESED
jgi:DNA-directed RNA polymerase subunit E'/Rpb7